MTAREYADASKNITARYMAGEIDGGGFVRENDKLWSEIRAAGMEDEVRECLYVNDEASVDRKIASYRSPNKTR